MSDSPPHCVAEEASKVADRTLGNIGKVDKFEF